MLWLALTGGIFFDIVITLQEHFNRIDRRQQHPLGMAHLKAQFRRASIEIIVMPFCSWKRFHECSIPVFFFILPCFNIGTFVDQVNKYKCQCEGVVTQE